MKLTRHELVHATNVQLRSIGLERDQNKGWLLRALDAEFSPDQIEMFHKMRGVKRPASNRVVWTMTITGPNSLRIYTETDDKADLRAALLRAAAHFA